MANTVTNTNNLSLRSILEKDKLTGPNFLDWERNLQIVLRHERKWYVLEEPLGEAPPANASTAIRNAYQKRSDDLLDVGCLMLATMSLELQTGLMNTNAYDMIRQLRDMFQTQARTERYDATRALNACKMAKGTSVSAHVMKMKRLLDHLERLGHPVPLQLATDTILNSLSDDYKQFVMNFNMNNMERSIAELHSMLKTAEQSMGTGTKTKDVLMVRDGGVKKKRGQRNTSKGKDQVQVSQSVPKAVDNRKGKGKGKKVKVNKAKAENRCFTCHEVRHWRHNCPKRHETGYDHSLNQFNQPRNLFSLPSLSSSISPRKKPDPVSVLIDRVLRVPFVREAFRDNVRRRLDTKLTRCCSRVVSAWRVHNAHPSSNPPIHILKDICQFLCSSMVGNILRGAVDGIPVYLGSIRRGNRRRHPSSWVDLRDEHGRGYGPVTVSRVERISQVPKWIPDTSSTSDGMLKVKTVEGVVVEY
ncbi:hypothetical protein OSB04_001831 [Centaurea solstitialis]|uniref:Zinc finger, CCHC-type n=1 Tax=Centaurea solstitialis TaxID=347529 RepID=A0AA38WSW2_9ASTR|nr:hypothetical protein OSB04_001831 [Centaurea solstitialis]